MFGKKFLWLYGTTILFFLLYIFIISDNNIAKHIELSRKLKNLNENIIQTKNQINNEFLYYQLRNDTGLLQQYAREQMNMQKEDEDVFVIIYK